MDVIRISSRGYLRAALSFVLLAGCGGGDEGSAREDPATTTAGTADLTTPGPAGTDASTTSTTTSTPTTTTTTTSTTTTTVPPVIAGADQVEQLTAPTGEGDRPLLSWEPIDEASTYLVIVYDADGAAYWSAITEQTEVYVGGPLPIPAERTGPRVSSGFTWAVFADDADGALLAASGRRPIEP